MSRWIFVSGAAALSLVLVAGLGCSRAETSIPLSAGEPSVEAETENDNEAGTSTGSSSSELSDPGSLGVFPAFMPPVAIGTETQECQLGTDPYSTCI